MNLRTIIVEDEPLSRIFLKNLLAEFCPSIIVVATAATESEAIHSIETLQPDLVFMDIELQQGTGFGVLQRTRYFEYHVIFTTALDHVGIRAIRYSGVDYIQKPIDIQSLQFLIDCMHGKMKKDTGKTAVKHLLQTLDNANVPTHLLIHTAAGAQYLQLADILFIKGWAQGCNFFTTSGSVTVPGTGVKDFEKLLDHGTFFRLHSSYIINLDHVLSKPDATDLCVILSDNSSIPVSPKKIQDLQLLLSGTTFQSVNQEKRY